MSFKICVTPSNHQFELEGKETILRAGMRSGLNLAHNCMNGSCGNCRARLVDGEIEQIRPHDYGLTPQQKEDHQFLTCCHRPLTDLVLEMHELDTVQDIPYQEIVVKVSKTDILVDDVMHLQLRASRSQVLDFLAGQKVKLYLKDGSSIRLGISSCPCDGLNLRFHFRNTGDEFCSQVFTQIKKGEKILLKGPSGDFTLNESSDAPLIFIAWDTGFSQVQSIIDHVISESAERNIRLIWLSDKTHYYKNYCRAWSDVLDDFQSETVSCKLPEASTELYKRMEMIEALEQHEIYAVLPNEQLSVFKQYLDDKGFPMGQLHTETC
jgi:CDP-4-dehydro-6-deoxyglucose reductase